MRHAYTVAALVHSPSDGLRTKVEEEPLPPRWKVTNSGIIVVRLSRASDYSLPQELTDESVHFQLQADEFGMTGHYVYVVAGDQGQALHPYATSRYVSPSEWHRSLAHFAGATLSRVGWFMQDGGMTLSIDRASVEVCDGRVQMTQELLLDRLPVEAPPSSPRLSGAVSTWQPAVDALYARLCCKQGCASHYAA